MTAGVALDFSPTSQPRSKGRLGAVQAGLDVVNGLMAWLSAVAVLAAALILTWEVAGRYFLGIPSIWQDEMSIFLLVGATFASAGWTQARRGHVAIDALSHVLPPRIDRLRARLADVLALAFCGFFAWKCGTLFLEAWSEGQTTDSAWGPPLWIPYFCMAAGMALLTLQLLVQTLEPRSR